jgi:5-methylcytosine-specific restriction endonuclease McrA
MSAHVALDEFHRARMGQARAAALERDGFRCRACGAGGPDVDGHVWRQPWLLPSYRPQNLVALCGPCHQAAHAPGAGRGTWT